MCMFNGLHLVNGNCHRPNVLYVKVCCFIYSLVAGIFIVSHHFIFLHVSTSLIVLNNPMYSAMQNAMNLLSSILIVKTL